VDSREDGCPALNVVMLGPPGAGKGTQAERLALRRNLPKISTGDILREAVQAGTDLGRAAKETMEAGNLVPDGVMIGIVQERLDRDDARCGFVLDGFPRTVRQARALVVVPEDVLVHRLAGRRICSKCGSNAAPEWTTACAKCGGSLVTRVDDGVDIVRERLKIYQQQTRPLVEYYSGRPSFFAIDGNQPPDSVTAQVDAAIDKATRVAL
jgi:adenylate kinase